MFRSNVTPKEQTQEQAGKEDLLIRFFESDWFDSWIALTCGLSAMSLAQHPLPPPPGPRPVHHQHLPTQV